MRESSKRKTVKTGTSRSIVYKTQALVELQALNSDATLVYKNKVANLLHFINITMTTMYFKTTESIMNYDFFFLQSKGKYIFQFHEECFSNQL